MNTVVTRYPHEGRGGFKKARKMDHHGYVAEHIIQKEKDPCGTLWYTVKYSVEHVVFVEKKVTD